MSFFSKLFGKSSPPQQDLIPFLDGVFGTLEGDAKSVITESLTGLDQTESGHCLLNYMFITIASVSNSLKIHLPERKGSDYSKAFKQLALSKIDRPYRVTEEKQAKLYQYIIGEVSNDLKNGNQDSIEDVGLKILSLSCLDREGFPSEMIHKCGIAAFECWKYATKRTEKNLGIKNEITIENFNEKLNLGEYFYLMTYQEHYEDFLDGMNNKKKIIAELFVFRAWTTQLGFRLFSSKPDISEKILESIIAQGKQLGIGMLNMLEQVDIESEINMSYMDIIDSRWQDYDKLLIANKSKDLPIPTKQICGQLTEFCNIQDPAKFVWICTDFIAHLNQIKETAIEKELFK